MPDPQNRSTRIVRRRRRFLLLPWSWISLGRSLLGLELLVRLMAFDNGRDCRPYCASDHSDVLNQREWQSSPPNTFPEPRYHKDNVLEKVKTQHVGKRYKCPEILYLNSPH